MELIIVLITIALYTGYKADQRITELARENFDLKNRLAKYE